MVIENFQHKKQLRSNTCWTPKLSFARWLLSRISAIIKLYFKSSYNIKQSHIFSFHRIYLSNIFVILFQQRRIYVSNYALIKRSVYGICICFLANQLLCSGILVFSRLRVFLHIVCVLVSTTERHRGYEIGCGGCSMLLCFTMTNHLPHEVRAHEKPKNCMHFAECRVLFVSCFPEKKRKPNHLWERDLISVSNCVY